MFTYILTMFSFHPLHKGKTIMSTVIVLCTFSMLNFQNFKFANEFTVGIFGGKNLTSAYIPLKYN